MPIITKSIADSQYFSNISFSGRFVFAMQKHYLFFASDPLVYLAVKTGLEAITAQIK